MILYISEKTELLAMVNNTRGNDTENEDQNPLSETVIRNIEAIKKELEDIEDAVDELPESGTDRSQDEGPLAGVSPVSNRVDSIIPEVVRSDGEIRLVISDFQTIISLLGLDLMQDRKSLCILFTDEVASTLSDQFPINSYFQKLYDSPAVEIKQASFSDTPVPPMAIIDDCTYYPVEFGSVSSYVLLEDTPLHSRLSAEFDAQFQGADALDIDVPPWGELLDGLSEATSPETANEFEDLVEAATPEKLDSLDEVSLALISAAKTGALQYNISKWGEEMKIASKATFSRKKTDLVDRGVITTESVPVETGRPRDRLLINKQKESDSDDTPCRDDEAQSETSSAGEITPDTESRESSPSNQSTSEKSDTQVQESGGNGQPEDDIDGMLAEVLLLDEGAE